MPDRFDEMAAKISNDFVDALVKTRGSLAVACAMEAAIAAALRSVAPIWRPIAEATDEIKNGTPVIVALIRRGCIWRVSDAYHNELAWYTIEGGKGISWATHFMPMPLPPAPGGPTDGTA